MTPFIQPEDIDNSFFEPGNEENFKSPLDRYHFAPASSNPLPSASSVSESRGKRSPVVDPAYNAKEVSGLKIDTRAPITPVGLQEAMFEPFSASDHHADQTPLEAEELPKPSLNLSKADYEASTPGAKEPAGDGLGKPAKEEPEKALLMR